jgi:hypothetical protein
MFYLALGETELSQRSGREHSADPSDCDMWGRLSFCAATGLRTARENFKFLKISFEKILFFDHAWSKMHVINVSKAHCTLSPKTAMSALV